MKTSFKKIFSLTTVFVATLTLATSCIKETFPEGDTATQEQIGASSSALSAALRGIPAQMVQWYLVYGEQVHETDMAYPQLMIAQTEMLGDMYPGGSESGYDWFRNYNTFNGNVGENSYFAYLPWFTLYQFIKSTNDVINSVDPASAAPDLKGMLGQAYAARAFDYYMLMVLFEPVENKYTDVSDVLGLTVPIVTEKTTGQDSKNNPRVTHDELVKFIYSDLDMAESLMEGYAPTDRRMPTLATTYGIRAKVALWDEDYAKAAEYARKAINASGATPMSESEWLDPKSAFTTATSSWMWYVSYASDNMANLCNFTGWIASENDWGYASLTRPMIDASLYNKIAKTDFRKYAFVDPAKYEFYNYQSVKGKEFIEEGPAYLALKFRCKDGNFETYTVGGAVDVPIMRVEEMYLIEAEAVGMTQGPAAGSQLLTQFMQTYRQPDYTFSTSVARNLQLEVLNQMRIEFWGEGNAFPSAKRIKPGVMQYYEGSNAPADIFRINCEGIKPNWNLCIPIFEINNNNGIVGKNNPDPTKAVVGPAVIGEYQ
jgi:hypothetical protein